MTNDALNSYTYDAENRIKQVNGGSTATYYYDGVGLRVKKVVGSTTTRYILSGKKVIAEYVNGSLSKEYIYSGNQLLATHEGGSLKYHHAEHLSTRVFTDSAGNKVGERGHYPFGEVWYESGQTDKWKFTHSTHPEGSGLAQGRPATSGIMNPGLITPSSATTPRAWAAL